MTISDFSSLTLAAIQAALKAGNILTKGFGTTYEITAKPGRQNFVTEYDKASEACMISFIREHFPSHSFLAEESGFTKQSESDDILWIIDPLDGTTNFAHHIPIFTISIAAYRQKEGLCGVIYQPITHELFIAERGKGAYLNEVRLHVSQTKQIDEAFIIASLPYDITAIPIFNLEKLTHITQQGAVLRNLGSAALALAYIAAGKADAFWMYNLYPWDLAAGQLLIEEAGGLLSQYGSTNSFNSPANILASNQALHSSLQEFLFS
jgi:myo-inositol-1(or 4)-monophosphatase